MSAAPVEDKSDKARPHIARFIRGAGAAALAVRSVALTNWGQLNIFPGGLRDGMKRWMNGLPGATKRLGAMMAR